MREKKRVSLSNLLKKNMKLTVAIGQFRICVIPKAGKPIKKKPHYERPLTGHGNVEG
jgi:hypothetical protein